ncbi:hypothetical protein AAKU67_002779 [Oxalobacteraceae bacterium GrIS 2.11]
MTQQSNIANFSNTATVPSAARAGRAIGAMFFSVFGCAWISNWAQASHPSNWSLLISVVLIGLLLLLCAITVYRHNKAAVDMIDPVQKKNTDSRFHIVNVG